jgi:hypothetical protein
VIANLPGFYLSLVVVVLAITVAHRVLLPWDQRWWNRDRW